VSREEHSHGPRSPRCRELFERLSEYLDGELDPALCAEMDTHLGGCAPCEAFLESLRRTIAVVERLPVPAIPPDLRRELIEAASRLKKGG